MAIRVDEVEISSDEIHREMQYHPASSRDEAEREAARALVLRQVLLHEAHQALDALSAATDEPLGEEELIADLLEESESGCGRITALRHAGQLSQSPPGWTRRSMPLGSHPPRWPS